MLPGLITPAATAEDSGSATPGQMENMLADGDRIIVWADLETTALTRVLKALARR